jgi:tetratricopeptide (TPR) repeat protein
MILKKLPLASTIVLFLALASAPHADDFIQQSIPGRWINPLLPEDLPDLEYPTYFKDLDKAKLEAFTGRYKKSLLSLRKAKDGDPLTVALIKATSLSALGKPDDALKALSDPKVIDKPDAHVLRARIVANQGKLTEAIDLLKKVATQHKQAADKHAVAAHFYLGQFLEQTGEMEAARQAYAYFEAYPDKLHAQEFEDAEELTLIGRGIDRWATLNSIYKDRVGLHNQVLEMTFGAVMTRIDRDYWPAKVASAEFHIARDDPKTASALLADVLSTNPNDARTLKLMGTLALDQLNFDMADKCVAGIRAVDPDAIDAGILETRNWLQQRRPKDATRTINTVLAKQPKNIEAMGLLAACYALQLQDEKTAEVLRKVDEIDPGNATAYFEVAEQLGSMRQYPRAEKMYKVVMERAPWWTAALNGLAVLYTQSGDEEEAFRTLERARLLDPFNFSTTNYLRLLDDLRNFARKETDHFIVFYDAKADPLIPEYFAEYLESIYKEVTGHFKHEPAVKTYIEVFPTQDAFAVRTHGMPELAATGASTGRVIALVSPRKGKNTQGTFDWATVLKHEFVHTVTLSQTELRIAHWMTEGLATYMERQPIRREWGPMLYNAVKGKKLFTLEELTFAFWRPKKPSDRMMAYAQSYWVCKYIEETFGHEKMLALLEEFRKGAGQDDAFPKILGKKVPDFEKDFGAWTEKEIASWGYDEETGKKVAELVKQGEAMIKARQFEQAIDIWNKAAKLRPLDVLPHQRLAGLYLNKEINQPEKAIPHLERVHRVELTDNRFAKRVARLYRDQNKLDKALEYALQGVYIDPYDMDAHELLGQLYEKTGNPAGAAKEKKAIATLEDWSKTDKDADRATNPG